MGRIEALKAVVWLLLQLNGLMSLPESEARNTPKENMERKLEPGTDYR